MRIKGLDYLRVFGIFLVIAYHFFPIGLPAGFLGVNLLFVLSGFLISYHLIDELFETFDIDLRKFYYKRFVRIYIPLLLMLFLTSIAGIFINKDYTVNFFGQFMAAFSSMYNYFEILRGGSYEAQFIKQVFMHTWFLAIELHFYVFWPLLMKFLFYLSKDSKAYKKKFTVYFNRTCMLLYILAYGLMVGLTLSDKVSTDFVYFFDLTRMGSFVIGGLLAAFVKRYSFKQIPYNEVTIIGSLLIFILSLTLSYMDNKTYYFGFLLTDLISVILLMTAFSNHDLMEDQTMKKLSNYTFAAYLFHWPVYVLVSHYIPGIGGLILTVLITIILILFTYHIFEPIVNGELVLGYDLSRFQFLTNCIIVFMVLSTFALAYAVDDNSDKMTSLEKQILIESLNQDLDEIKRDKAEIDKLIDLRNQEILVETKQETKITLIADSVLLGHRQYLEENINNLVVNAEGYRELDYADEMISQMVSTNNLGDLVILALGTNAVDDPYVTLKDAIDALPKGTRLILVTVYDNRYPTPHRVSRAMHEIAKSYDFITVMEWEEEGISHPEFYENTDGVHFYGNIAAYEKYLELLEEAIDQALLKPAKE